jgi:dihydropteroate synthase
MKKLIYTIGDKIFDFNNNVFIMGILNVTPDSFYDGGTHFNKTSAIEHGIKIAEAGADIIDIGGESTRPFSEAVSLEQEMERVIPVIEGLRSRINIPISIDTYKSRVAGEALKSGAKIINDISGMTFDPEMIKVVDEFNATIIISHIKGTPKTMQNDPEYIDVIKEIQDFFKERIDTAKSHNIENIILDPGIGFGKKLNHNISIIKNLKEFRELGYPLLIGVSRKRFIGELLKAEPEDRLFGTAGAVAISVYNGANIVRVHDVKEMRDVARVSYFIKSQFTE